MKKVKISLAALAFVLATGAAFATKSHSENADPCTSTTQCATNPAAVCCFDEQLGIDRLGDKQ